MAADDYHVIVFEILSYLYKCLKKGDTPNADDINNYKQLHGINTRYWSYVLVHLLDDGYIEGAEKVGVMGAAWKHVKLLDDLAITPKGIDYLAENSTMQKIANGTFEIIKAAVVGVIGG